MIDWRGMEYREGSTVVYPRGSGRSITMVEGIVEKIEPATERDWEPVGDLGYKEVRKPIPDRFVVHIRRTRGARWNVGGTQERQYYEAQLSKIRNTENITVVPTWKSSTESS